MATSPRPTKHEIKPKDPTLVKKIEVEAVKMCFHDGARQRVGTRFMVFEHELNDGMRKVSDIPAAEAIDVEVVDAEAPTGAQEVI